MLKRYALSAVLITGGLVALVVMLFVPPIPQDAAYHRFADTRRLLGIPNFWDTVSNLLFVALGAWGVLEAARAMRRDGFRDRRVHLSYLAFFAAIFATGFGSGWYHLAPDNASIFWDRLPLAMAFMALFAGVAHERLRIRGKGALLVTLMALGGMSVVYWYRGELVGRGDLRPYLLVQFLPMFFIPFLLWLVPSRFTRTADLWMVLGLYAVAKVAEVLDAHLWAAGGILSGHTLKHLLAAWAVLQVVRMIRRRTRVEAKTTL